MNFYFLVKLMKIWNLSGGILKIVKYVISLLFATFNFKFCKFGSFYQFTIIRHISNHGRYIVLMDL